MGKRFAEISALEGFLAGCACVLAMGMIILTLLPASPAPAATVAAPIVAAAPKAEQECPPPVCPPQLSCEGLINKDSCDSRCRAAVKRQDSLSRGLPISIELAKDVASDFGPGEYRVIMADCNNNVFTGFSPRNRAIPLYFLWPVSKTCACATNKSVLRLAADGSCTTVP